MLIVLIFPEVSVDQLVDALARIVQFFSDLCIGLSVPEFLSKDMVKQRVIDVIHPLFHFFDCFCVFRFTFPQ